MKNKVILICGLAVLSLFLVFSCFAEAKNIKLYLSPEGNDQNPGTVNAPFLTIEKARDAVRLLRKSLPDQAVTVYIHNGVYPIEKALKFTAENSGNEKAPVTYQAVEGETPVLRGSKPVKNWELLKDDAKLNIPDDQGGVDIFHNPSYRGIVIRYNRWSDISGGTRHGAAGVRLDDMISGFLQLFCGDELFVVGRETVAGNIGQSSDSKENI